MDRQKKMAKTAEPPIIKKYANRRLYNTGTSSYVTLEDLAEMVKAMPKLDWTQRESVRADLRRKVRRLLAMYGYPPDLSEDATQLVLKQAELATEFSD